jgi:hypothetical protein
MPCIFCRSEENLTDEHVFPAFMGGELVAKDGSCKRCNGEFAVLEGKLKDATAPLLHLLQIENRYGIVPNASVNAEIRGLDMKNLQGFVDVDGHVKLFDRVIDATNEDGRKVRRGFFMTKGAGDKFAERARAKGNDVIEREVPERIVVDVDFTLTTPFAFSVEARKVAAKVALAAIAYEFGMSFASRHSLIHLDKRAWRQAIGTFGFGFSQTKG